MPSLLAYLASKFSDQNEVVATDALAFILRHSPAAMEALSGLLAEGASQPILVSRVTPQHIAGDESRPDLATFGPGGELTAFIEAKFWAGLTDAQPVEYLRRLEQAGGKALLFVVPEERLASMWTELTHRAGAASVAPQDCGKPDARVAVSAGGVRMAVVAWKRLLSVFSATCLREQDASAVANLDQLSGLVGRFEDEGFGPMTAEDLTDISLPRRVRALAAIVQSVVAKGEADGLISLTGSRPTHDWTSAGRYFSLLHGNGWIGIDHDAWARYHSSPLWVWFRANEWSRGHEVRRALAAWETGEQKRMFVNEDDSVSVPLFIRPGAERDEVIDDLVGQLRELDTALAAAGLVRGSAPAPVT